MTKDTAVKVEETGMSRRAEDLLQVYKTLAFDLPLASVRWAFGAANDKESTTALWKGYDASVRLATATVDSMYRSQSLSEIVGTTVNQMLRLQHLSNSANSFFATSLRKPFTPPVTPEVHTLAAHVQALDARLNETTSARPHRAATTRSRSRKVRIQEPVQTPVNSLSHQESLQIAA